MASSADIKVNADTQNAAGEVKNLGKEVKNLSEHVEGVSEKLKGGAEAFKELSKASEDARKAMEEGASPLQVLMDQLPELVVTFAELAGKCGLAGIAVAAVGAAAYSTVRYFMEMDDKIKSISGHMALMGRGAEAAPKVVEGWANQLVIQFGAGKLAALNMIEAVTNAAPTLSAPLQHMAADFAETMATIGNVTKKEDLDKIGSVLSKSISGDFSAIRALDEKYKLLSAAQLDALDKAEAENNKDAAALIIKQALIDKYGAVYDALIKLSKAQEEYAQLSAGVGMEGIPTAGMSEAADAVTQAKADLENAKKNIKGPDEGERSDRARQHQLIADTATALQQRNQVADESARQMAQHEADAWAQLIETAHLSGAALTQAREHLADAEKRIANTTSAELAEQLRDRLSVQQALRADDRTATLRGEVASYKEVLANQQLIGRERDAVSRDLKVAEAQLARQTVQDQLASIKDQVAATREGSKEREEALAGELAYVKANYGARSAEARRVEQEITAAHKATLDAEVAHLREDLGASLQSMKVRDDVLAQISEKQRARYGSDSSALRKAQETDLTTVRKYLDDKAKEDIDQSNEDWQRYAKDQEQKRQLQNMSLAEVASAKRAEVKAQNDATVKILEGYKQQALAAAAVSGEEARVAKDYDDKISKIKRAAEQQDREIVRQLERDKQKEYQQTVSGITKSMGTMVQGLVTGTKTVRQAVGDMAKSALSELVGMAEKQASTWIESNLLKQDSDQDTATKAMAQSVETATAQINDAAATGAANAYASASAGPEWWIAPAISAAVQLAISGLTSSLSSAAGGWGRVPADGMLTELHKDEMVLPASIASPLRSALATQTVPSLAVPAYAAANLNLPGGGAANTNGVSGIGGGANVTFTVQAMDSRDVASFFNRHGDKLVSALRGQKRNFSF
ncbi:hypothetical protein [Nitrospirillum sp. BR 11828]|uniref:hypothetical protein n=1 Tax=Nitrospirillum sp. BR 11828 TaxID=3104325 RepID=UPI002ACAC9E8|nr:hypothetical protein [Nitrospirillum sp. BR 11828]MDZ5648949.1 hypothetical protein [Nitrospirillum sp. BR 11828]